jgi:hypothetical protein
MDPRSMARARIRLIAEPRLSVEAPPLTPPGLTSLIYAGAKYIGVA